MPDLSVRNYDSLFYLSDSLLMKKLEEINDSLHVIIGNTEPVSDMNKYVDLSEGTIAIIAIGISVFALVVSFLCFRYQKMSAKQLIIANRKKPNLYPIARKLYDNSINLQIIYEYDSDYSMSYTIEQRHPVEKRSSNKKHFFYTHYPSESLLCKMKLPEDVIMLEKYEVYENDDIYNMAFTIMDNIIKYNENIERAIAHMQNKSSDDVIKKDKDDLLSYSRKLLRMMYDLDELVWKAEKPRFKIRHKNRSDRQLERDVSLFVASRFFAKTQSITSDVVISDPYFILTGSVVDTPQNIDIIELHKKYEYFCKAKPKRQFDSEETFDKYLKNAVYCINLINNREREDTKDSSCNKKYKKSWIIMQKKTNGDRGNQFEKARFRGAIDDSSNSVLSKLLSPFLISIYQLFKAKDTDVKIDKKFFNDSPLRRNVENIIGGYYSNRRGVYDNIIKQLDEGVLDMECIYRYDTVLQIFINKHSLLSESSVHIYNNEKRRIERKKILMSEREKQSKANDNNK